MNSKPTIAQLLPISLVCAAHAMAVLGTAAALAVWVMQPEALSLVWDSLQAGVLRRQTLLGALGHLGISAALWGTLWLAARWVRARWRRGGAPKVRLRAAGSVMVETLIVMPVLLLLVFGLAQLAINNIVGVMVNAATFEATRAAWLWMPEAHSGRMGALSKEDAEEKARIQATLVLLPVAPGSYGIRVPLSDAAAQARGMVVASQLTTLDTDAGNQGMTMADALTLTSLTQPRARSFSDALDSRRFIERSATKFNAAYATTRVEIEEDEDADSLKVTVVYRHLCAMPLVGAVFGEVGHAIPDAPESTKGYFFEVKRVFERRRLAAPRSNWPKGGV